MSTRLERLRALLNARHLDSVLITHPNNRFYLSGYSGEDDPPNESAGVLLVAADRELLLTGATNEAWAAAEAPDWTVQPWDRPWTGTVAKLLIEWEARRVGFEEDAINVSTYNELIATLENGVELVPLADTVDQLRLIKDEAEQRAMAHVIDLTDRAFAAATSDLQAGITEKALAWRIEQRIHEFGGDGLAFPVIVAAGPHAARPHHNPTDRQIEVGEPIIIDMGARLAGYNGDLTRTIWLGEPGPRLFEIYDIVRRAQEAALAFLRAGVTGKEADNVARLVVDEAGYGEYFTHGLGHGLGVRVHEAPNASKASENILVAGSVLTVEPGIYMPDWGGVRIEDVGIVRDDGFEVLTRAPKRTPEPDGSAPRGNAR